MKMGSDQYYEPNQSLDINEGRSTRLTCISKARPAAVITLNITYGSYEVLSESYTIRDANTAGLYKTSSMIRAEYIRDPSGPSAGTVTCTVENYDGSYQEQLNATLNINGEFTFFKEWSTLYGRSTAIRAIFIVL